MAATKDGKTGAKDEKKDKATTDGVITAVYKVNLHCPKCATQIKKPLLRTQGVHSVDVEIEKGEIKVKGVIDVMKVHKLIAKLSKKKVDLISPHPQVKVIDKEKPPAATATPKKLKETEEKIIHTTTMKVHLHCEKCEKDLQMKLLKHRGIHSVKIDAKAQTVTVQGTLKSDKLLSYIRKNVHKHAEIISSKKEGEDKKTAEGKTDAVKDHKANKSSEKQITQVTELEIISSKKEEEDKKKAEGKTDAVKDHKANKSSEKQITQVTEFKQEVMVEAKSKDGNVPYFVHYVYAPQLFSEENPNACCVI